MSTILPFLNFAPAAARASLVASLAMLLPACGSSTSSTLGDPGGATSPAGASGGGASPGAGGTTPSGAGAGGMAAGGMTVSAGASSGCNQPTISTPTPCNDQYPATSILALRNGKAAGCFAMSHVGLVARTDSLTEPRLYVQDARGGDSSALMAKCASA